MQKLDKEVQFYDKIIVEAQHEVRTKNSALKDVEKANFSEKLVCVKKGENEQEIKYNFAKRKSTFCSKDAVSKKKLRTTP